MSFSAQVKEEISRLPAEHKKYAAAELYAAFLSVGVLSLSSSGLALKISFEQHFTARRFYQLLRDFFHVDCEILQLNNNLNTKKTFSLVITGRQTVTQLLADIGFPADHLLSVTPDTALFLTQRERIHFLRGLFLSCGSLTHPQKNYHAEFVLKSRESAQFTGKILKKAELFFKTVLRKSDYVIYLKSGDSISNLLSLLGAHASLLEYENIRVLKDMRNNINRAVNCETANISKTVSAAQKQMMDIRKIEERCGLDRLSPVLGEAAMLRLSHPDSTLSELAELAGTSKSAMNHRLRKLKQIAEEL